LNELTLLMITAVKQA